MKENLKIFLSSRVVSGYSKDLNCTISKLMPDREIARETILEMGFEPMGWENIGPDSIPVETAYLEELKTSDIAVFLIWQTLGDGVKEEYIEAEKHGIPRLVLIKELAWGEKRTKECDLFIKNYLETKKSGIVTGTYRSLAELRNELKKGLARHISRAIRDSVFFRVYGAYNLYMAAEQIGRESKKILYMAQRTSSLIFPSEFYETEDAFEAEQRLKDQLENWIDKIRSNKKVKMVLMCS